MKAIINITLSWLCVELVLLPLTALLRQPSAAIPIVFGCLLVLSLTLSVVWVSSGKDGIYSPRGLLSLVIVQAILFVILHMPLFNAGYSVATVIVDLVALIVMFLGGGVLYRLRGTNK